mmetsp:Transcript_26771/g.58077  ORF Transcript_26771/g.58077 Transcript_26771/m.58077 type:complete len:205 (-) Transcript_26771:305-919(-)
MLTLRLMVATTNSLVFRRLSELRCPRRASMSSAGSASTNLSAHASRALSSNSSSPSSPIRGKSTLPFIIRAIFIRPSLPASKPCAVDIAVLTPSLGLISISSDGDVSTTITALPTDLSMTSSCSSSKTGRSITVFSSVPSCWAIPSSSASVTPSYSESVLVAALALASATALPILSTNSGERDMSVDICWMASVVAASMMGGGT